MDCIYPTELQLNEFNRGTVLDLNLCISNGPVSTKLYDKRDDFDFDKVNLPFLDGDVPPVYLIWGIHIYQLIRFARVFFLKS